jgi:hypothetical protein
MERRTIASGPMTDEEIAFVQVLIDEGWPKQQIQQTYGLSFGMLKRHWPDFKGMDFREAGALGGYKSRHKL